MTEHTTTTHSWETGDRGRQAHCTTCSCGWEGTTRGSRHEAEEDGRRHEEKQS